MPKGRITITIELDLLDEVQTAVNDGSCRSVSQWISEAMADRLAEEQRLAVLRQMIAEYEAEHGVITDEEMAEQAQRDRDAAAAIRAAAEARLAAQQTG